jgi:hypothetical protein
VHGEEKQAMLFKEILNGNNLNQVHYPGLHESVEI